MNVGKVQQIIGPAVDIRFEKGKLPELYNAITIKAGLNERGEPIAYEEGTTQIDLTLEVVQHLGDELVRCIAMGSTDGIVRGMEAHDTGNPISVPVGRSTLGRVLNITGEPIDGKGEIEAEGTLPYSQRIT